MKHNLVCLINGHIFSGLIRKGKYPLEPETPLCANCKEPLHWSYDIPDRPCWRVK